MSPVMILMKDAINPEIQKNQVGLHFFNREYDLSDDTTLNGGIRWESIRSRLSRNC